MTARTRTARPPAATLPPLGPVGWLRWVWRQLTSMRTALLLLLALAIGAVPGSIFPQRAIDAGRTTDWIAQHPTAGPILDRLGFFEVYAAPWFAAIYLLLLISLVGCVLPRSMAHLRAIGAQPPRAPRRLARLAAHTEAELDATPEEVLAAAREALKRKRFRVHSHDGESVSAESGHLKETGNLVFHLALVGIIVGVAVGHLWGWKGDVILPEGQTFANTLIRYDTFAPGPLVDDTDLSPFTIGLDKLDAVFEENVKGKGQFGSPRDFTAHVRVAPSPSVPAKPMTIKVNHPLELDGATAFLLGNGYAPKVTVRAADGTELFDNTVPFLAQDNNYTSAGAIKVPSASPKELGFSGFFLPTASMDPTLGPQSLFPQALKPALVLAVYEGDLAPGGRPQSVYTLDTSAMTQVKNAKGAPLSLWIEPGQTIELPGGRGSITFDSVQRFAGLSIRHDPGKGLTLGSALVALAGLIGSLVVKRRRVFVRVAPAADGASTLMTIGGLAKDDDEGMPDIVEELLDTIRDKTGKAVRTAS